MPFDGSYPVSFFPLACHVVHVDGVLDAVGVDEVAFGTLQVSDDNGYYLTDMRKIMFYKKLLRTENSIMLTLVNIARPVINSILPSIIMF